MQQALLFDTLQDAKVRCNICQWRCIINPGRSGVCRMYRNQNGVLYNMNYAQVSSVAVDPIEKKPLFHFYPGTQVYSLGGWGCNFHCLHCQNWQISCPEVDEPWQDSREILPEMAIAQAKRQGCRGIAWTYNEPSVWFEYTLDSAKLAKANNLYTVYVTNGYMTPEALDIIGPYLDAWRVDVKGFNEKVYRDLAKITHWRGILEVAERAKSKWRMHVEVVTNIISGMNDDDTQLEGIALWIHDKLGELTPWHITRSYPQYRMMDMQATPLGALEHAYEIGRKVGLKFIYSGNVPGYKEHTICYSCGREVVKRYGYETEVIGLKGSKCNFCGAELNFRV
jgi:pyruvate formate lyase activating enzyme